ncbi:MAG: phosphatidate cytidylyltransferase [Planctomycetota bacterium]|nr:phosphatidate cytidylyltransferase [Planctomycetota bacterium]
MGRKVDLMLRHFAIVSSFCLLVSSSLIAYAQNEPAAITAAEAAVVEVPTVEVPTIGAKAIEPQSVPPTPEPGSQGTTASKAQPSDEVVVDNASKSVATGSGTTAKPLRQISRNAISYPLLILFSSVVIALGITTAIARYLTRQPNSSFNPAQLQRFVLRLRAWWTICLFVVFGLVVHRIGIIILFGLISFWAFREFITMTPTRRGDHRALFWSLVVFTPLQYVLIGLGETNWEWKSGEPVDFYGVYSIMIPVYASLFIPARIAMAGDHKRFLERSAQITSGLLICVYALSHVPALLDLDLADSSHNRWTGSSEGLVFFFILISQVADVLQWSWGQIAGKHVVAKEISPSRTWEGCIGGSLSAGLVGAVLYKVTPFQMGEAALISIIIAFVGFAGGMTMSAIKRNRNVQDYGTLVLGHAGVLDRIDTICFSAPVFYHITRFFFSI